MAALRPENYMQPVPVNVGCPPARGANDPLPSGYVEFVRARVDARNAARREAGLGPVGGACGGRKHCICSGLRCDDLWAQWVAAGCPAAAAPAPLVHNAHHGHHGHHGHPEVIGNEENFGFVGNIGNEINGNNGANNNQSNNVTNVSSIRSNNTFDVELYKSNRKVAKQIQNNRRTQRLINKFTKNNSNNLRRRRQPATRRLRR